MRRAARRDANELDLVKIARQLHWLLWKLDEPCDWLGLHRGRFHAVEIKTEDGELTGNQVIFHRDVSNAGGKVLVWRTLDDILRDTRPT